MRAAFFPKLAISGIKKNGQVYFPYLLTCVVMVMMFYIMHSLSNSPLMTTFKGGRNVAVCLGLAKFVIAVFALLFLLYSNSFLTRRRYKEFGLYHVLGMGKRGLRRIVFWESVFTAAIGLTGGLFCGILFSKLAELLLANIVKYEIVGYSLWIDPKAVRFSLGLFGLIFLILMVKSLITVQMTKSLELFQSEKLGEKPPKTNWFLALVGFALLVGAYIISCSIKTPLSALLFFFIAVIMVIIATYFLFIAGSVVVCRILKNNKKYYYQKNHFVSVSTMVFRMRRNGAGLASICILCTMVLVMVSASCCMYFGLQDTINTRYCRDTEISLHLTNYEAFKNGGKERLIDAMRNMISRSGVQSKNELTYTYIEMPVIIEGNEVQSGTELEEEMGGLDEIAEYGLLKYLVIIPLEDYNYNMNTDLTLSEDEIFVYQSGFTYTESTFATWGKTWNIKERLETMFPIGELGASVIPTMIMIVPDLDVYEPIMTKDMYDMQGALLCWYYGYNIDAEEDKKIEIYNEMRNLLHKDEELSFIKDENGGMSYYSSCKTLEVDDMIGLYGGVFFIGIVLSILFISAMALIIYYKQISEGFEDQKRFEIMQKVGMTGKDIRQSISSQVLTVFFAPLVMAGIHTAFAFPMIWRILNLLYINNLQFLIVITILSFLAFGVFYAILYKFTARVYYRIVSGANRA